MMMSRFEFSVKKIICVLFAAVMVLSATSCSKRNGDGHMSDPSKKGTLGISTAKDGTLLLDGEPVYAFGVNIFDIFINKRLNDPDYDCEAPFKALHDAGIPVARVCIGPYHVAHLAKFAYSHDEYFEALDDVIAAAEKWEIGLFASMSWNSWTIPEFVGEHLSAMGDPESLTVGFAKYYYTEVVKRYKNSPAIWAWEFGNEYNLNSDLVYVAAGTEYLPGQVTFTGEPRTMADYYTSYDIQKYYQTVSEEIRKIDGRLITGGDSELSERPASLRRESRWGADTVDDIADTTLLFAPSPMEAVSSHMYQGALPDENSYRDFQKVLKDALEACKKVKKGYYIGEYGPGTCWNDQTGTLEMYKGCVDRIHEACLDQGVQIALAWNCTTDYDGTEKSLASDLGVYWFHETEKLNAKLKAEGKQDNIASYWANAVKMFDYDKIAHSCSNYLMGTGCPMTALTISEDGAGLVYWTGSDYGTNAEISFDFETGAFILEDRDESSKTFVKNTEVRGLKKDGSYKLSFKMKTENISGEGVTVKIGSPNFFTKEGIKCDKDGEWQLFEFETGAPTSEKESYSVGFYFTEQSGKIWLNNVKISDVG